MAEHPTSTTDNRVVSIRTGRRYQPARDLPSIPAPAGYLDKFARSDEPDDFRHRMTVNVVAFVFVALLILAGIWLADTIVTMRKNQDCVLTGKRNCAPIEAPAATR